MTIKIETIEDAIFSLCKRAFTKILWRDSATEELWTHRAKTLRKHGLTIFTIDSPFAKKKLEVDVDRLDDPIERRRLIRKLKAPHPSKWMSVELTIDREKLISDSKYLTDMAKVLAYQFTKKLTPVDCVMKVVLLLRLCENTITHCLDHMFHLDTNAETVSQFILRSLVEELVDTHPLMIAALEDIRSTAAAARADLKEELKIIAHETMERVDKRWQAILAEVEEHFEELETQLCEYAQKDRARTDEMLAKSKRELEADPEEEFKKAVDQRLKDRKKKK